CADSNVLLGLKQFGGVLHLFKFALFFGEFFPQSLNFFALLIDLFQNDFNRAFLNPAFALSGVGLASAALLCFGGHGFLLSCNCFFLCSLISRRSMSLTLTYRSCSSSPASASITTR